MTVDSDEVQQFEKFLGNIETAILCIMTLVVVSEKQAVVRMIEKLIADGNLSENSKKLAQLTIDDLTT